MDVPLVSCIMPTRNRRRFVGQAIRYFLRQDYPSRELIIVDDGEDSIGGLVPKDQRIRYVRLEAPLSLAAKRNRACELAKGTLIAHWDDDDWMAANRLSTQVQALQAVGAQVCGARELLYYHLEAGQAWLYRPQAGDRSQLASGTLLYRRTAWEACPFVEHAAVAPVAQFDPSAVRALSDPWFYIALLHGENTNPRNMNDPRWQRRPSSLISERLGGDREFYVVLRSGPSAPAPDPRQGYLVSCIMPTYNRRAFVPQAIRSFLRQDYPRKELIVVDDGTDRVCDLIPRDERVRYIGLPRRFSIGEKRNQACEASRGKIIVLWDDDDWYATHRISYQVMPLLEGQAEITGLGNSFFFSLPTNQFWSCTHSLSEQLFLKGVVSGTIAFWKSMWGAEARFPDTSLAEDAEFVRIVTRGGARLKRLCNEGTFVYVRHGANTWQFSPGSQLDKRAWHKIEMPSFIPDADRRFYRSLRDSAYEEQPESPAPRPSQVSKDSQ